LNYPDSGRSVDRKRSAAAHIQSPETTIDEYFIGVDSRTPQLRNDSNIAEITIQVGVEKRQPFGGLCTLLLWRRIL